MTAPDLSKIRVGHRALVEQVARECFDPTKWMVWTEPTLGARRERMVKPDILAISKSWANYEVRVVECKVTQSDLDTELRTLKYEKSFPWCHRMSIAVGPGIKVDKTQGHPLGLIQWTRGGMRTKKAPPLLTTPGAGENVRSWELFHALNMGETRFTPKDRLYRQLSRVEALRRLDLKKEGYELYGQAMGRIRDELKKLERARMSPDRAAEEARQQFRSELREFLGTSRWFNIDDPWTIIRGLVDARATAFAHGMEEDLKKLLSIAEGR